MGRRRKVISKDELKTMSEAELKEFIRKQHRRDLCRINQQKYRDRQKNKEADLEGAITVLNSKINRATSFNMLLKQGKVNDPFHSIQIRGLVASMYGDLFDYGMDKRNKTFYQTQESFLGFNFDEKVIVLSEKFKPGVQALVDQWKLYTTLHHQFRMKKVAIEKIDPDGNLFRLTTELSFTISHRTIASLYPHMLLDHEFLQKVIGERLAFKCNQLLQFDERNQVVTLHAEYEMVQAWIKLLNDPVLATRVVGGNLIDSTCYITADIEPDLVLEQDEPEMNCSSPSSLDEPRPTEIVTSDGDCMGTPPPQQMKITHLLS